MMPKPTTAAAQQGVELSERLATLLVAMSMLLLVVMQAVATARTPGEQPGPVLAGLIRSI
jgi:hypothetical protein